MERMNIAIDNRENDINVIDHTYYKYADTKEIIKMINLDASSAIDIVCDIISQSLSLNREERNVLSVILSNPKVKDKYKLRDLYITKYRKSKATFERAMNVLSTGRVVRCTVNNVITVNSGYNIADADTNKKYIVIELNNE